MMAQCVICWISSHKGACGGWQTGRIHLRLWELTHEMTKSSDLTDMFSLKATVYEQKQYLHMSARNEVASYFKKRDKKYSELKVLLIMCNMSAHPMGYAVNIFVRLWIYVRESRRNNRRSLCVFMELNKFISFVKYMQRRTKLEFEIIVE